MCSDNVVPRRLAALVLLAVGLGEVRAAMDFTDVTAAAGISHQYVPGVPAEQREFAWMTGGAVAEDFNGDGWIDLYALQGHGDPNLLYINQGDGTFEDEAFLRNADLSGDLVACAAADYDNDGDIDLVVTSYLGPHHLLINDGTGNFTVDSQLLAVPENIATSPSWADIDNDGDLDLALGAWKKETQLLIYWNDGEGGLEVGQSLPGDFVFTPGFADLDGDRLPDLLAVSDFGNMEWYHNQGGLFQLAGSSDIRFGMGVATGDIDNDGDLDVFMTSISGAIDPWDGNRLLTNDGFGGLSDNTDAAQVREGFWGWGAAMSDFDLDGDLDIYHANGFPDGTDGVIFWRDTPAKMFENDGGGVFASIDAGAATDRRPGRAVVAFDYDNDGDQDLFVVNNHQLQPDGQRDPGVPLLLRNDTVSENHWLKVSLHGRSNPHHADGIGSRVYLSRGSSMQMRELNASSGGFGHGPGRIAHFGLGNDPVVDQVRTVWTNGDEVILENVAADQALIIDSPMATASKRLLPPGGGEVLFTVDEAHFPAGSVVEWHANGTVRANPASITFTTPGEHTVELRVSDGGDAPSFLRRELLTVTVEEAPAAVETIARIWNEQNLDAIRIDFPAPTKHARNLFHTSVAMWDAWAAYSGSAVGYLHRESASAADIESARREAVSYAAYRVLRERYATAVNGSTTLLRLDQQMEELGYETDFVSAIGDTPAALGNRVAATVLRYYDSDGWDNLGGFLGGDYEAINEPLDLRNAGTTLVDGNRWQPLSFVVAVTQNGQITSLTQSFVGPNWGAVRPFAQVSLDEDPLHLDPGPPPQLGGVGDEAYKAGNLRVIELSSRLDPDSGEMIDISPGMLGNNPLGTNDGTGHPFNPVTGAPYAPNLVRMGDFSRVLAEFWADGPNSETPPGHWNTLANGVVDSAGFSRRLGGVGDPLDPLEWDVKMYFALNGALHDAAIAAWGCKRVYDYIRPISSIRHLGSRGQSSSPELPAYDPLGIPLVPGLVELVTPESSSAGERHEHLAGSVNQVTIRAWLGSEGISPGTEHAGVGWILAEEWKPYQRDTFVTPAFPGYVSGHSTFSRAAAEVLTEMTGTAYFPGGLGTFTAPAGEFLEFEDGPTGDVVLQWASYYDAADQAGISRLYGGIHVPADDGPGRVMGSTCGLAAWDLARKYFDGSIVDQPFASRLDSRASAGDFELKWDAERGALYRLQQSEDPAVGFTDMGEWIQAVETLERVAVPAPTPASPRKFFRVVRSWDGP